MTHFFEKVQQERYWVPRFAVETVICMIIKWSDLPTTNKMKNLSNNSASPPVWPDKNRQMSIKVAQKWLQ